jgi:hypothetical protein
MVVTYKNKRTELQPAIQLPHVMKAPSVPFRRFRQFRSCMIFAANNQGKCVPIPNTQTQNQAGSAHCRRNLFLTSNLQGKIYFKIFVVKVTNFQ